MSDNEPHAGTFADQTVPAEIYCKTSLLVKWEQDRKTAEMIHKISNNKYLSKKAKNRRLKEINTKLLYNIVNGAIKLDIQEKYNTPIFDIIFCDNKLLLVVQTWQRSLNNGLIVEKLSSANDMNWDCLNDIKANWDEFIGPFSDKDTINGYCCCTNETRLNDALNLIKWFNKYKKKMDETKFRFWFDEADLTIIAPKRVELVNKIRRYTDIVEEVVFITATPEDRRGGVLTQYGELNIHPLEIPTDTTTYLQWKEIDKEFVEQDNSLSYAHYVKKCLERKPLVNGDLLFVPAQNTKKSHNKIATLLLEKNMADIVFVINGDDKEFRLRYNSGTGYCSIKEDLIKIPFSKYLEEMCYNTNLEEDDPENCITKRVAITGKICIGRGISINNPNKCITRSILGETSSRFSKRSDAHNSQLSGRLGGNIKKWDNYRPPFVQTTKKIDEAINIQRNMTEWLKQQDSASVSTWREHYNTECEIAGIRKAKRHKYGTFVFKFKSHQIMKLFIKYKLNECLKTDVKIKIRGPTKKTTERRNANGKLKYKWDYKPVKQGVRDESFIEDPKVLRQGFYQGSFDDIDLKLVKSKKAGRAIPYYTKDDQEMWCFVTPEKYYNNELKRYNAKIIYYDEETKLFKTDAVQIIPAFK